MYLHCLLFYKPPESVEFRIRPYSVECTRSRSISEVKQLQAGLVLGWVTAWEYPVPYPFFLFISFLYSPAPLRGAAAGAPRSVSRFARNAPRCARAACGPAERGRAIQRVVAISFLPTPQNYFGQLPTRWEKNEANMFKSFAVIIFKRKMVVARHFDSTNKIILN